MGGLHRSKRNKVIFGVCGGLAEYFRVDPVLIRIIFVIIAFSGVSILLYLVAALIMPEDREYGGDQDRWGSAGQASGSQDANSQDAGSYTDNGPRTGEGSYTETGTGTDSSFEDEFNAGADNWDSPPKYETGKNRGIIGVILIGLGILFLGRQLIPALFDSRYVVPVLLVVIGGIIVYRGRR